MDKRISEEVHELLVEITSTITEQFKEKELAFLSSEAKIELTLRNKIAWKLQCALDKMYDDGLIDQHYLVRMEWTPYVKDLKAKKRKVDMAILRQDNSTNSYTQCIAMVEFKAHSLQKDEKCFIDEYKKDREKMLAFVQSKELVGNMEVRLYFILFQQLHLRPIMKYQNAFTYLKNINACFNFKGKKEEELNHTIELKKIKKYWQRMFESPNEDFLCFENDLGDFFDHQSYLETVIWEVDKDSKTHKSAT